MPKHGLGLNDFESDQTYTNKKMNDIWSYFLFLLSFPVNKTGERGDKRIVILNSLTETSSSEQFAISD